MTLHGLANRKNDLCQQGLHSREASPQADAADLLGWLGLRGLPTAVVSMSQNADAALTAVGLLDHVDLVVDWGTATTLHSAESPDPDFYLHAAEQLSVARARTVVVDDAVAGVEAGVTGSSGWSESTEAISATSDMSAGPMWC